LGFEISDDDLCSHFHSLQAADPNVCGEKSRVCDIRKCVLHEENSVKNKQTKGACKLATVNCCLESQAICFDNDCGVSKGVLVNVP